MPCPSPVSPWHRVWHRVCVPLWTFRSGFYDPVKLMASLRSYRGTSMSRLSSGASTACTDAIFVPHLRKLGSNVH